MLGYESKDEKSDVKQNRAKEDNQDVRITSENDVTKINKNEPGSKSPPREENYYYVDNELKKQGACEFSLLNTFDATKNNIPDREQKQSLESLNEPLKESEEKSIPEKNQLKEDEAPECSKQPRGLWYEEPLFFTPDDPRFEGAKKFVKFSNPDYAKTFYNLRKQVKDVLRSKEQKVQQHANQCPGTKVDLCNKKKKFKANMNT